MDAKGEETNKSAPSHHLANRADCNSFIGSTIIQSLLIVVLYNSSDKGSHATAQLEVRDLSKSNFGFACCNKIRICGVARESLVVRDKGSQRPTTKAQASPDFTGGEGERGGRAK